jgi:hypothetical protein
MKIYSRYDQMSKERFSAWTRRYEHITPVYEQHPREDYHHISAKYPIFVVADGVTLKRNIHGDYPAQSGCFELAKIFCEKVIEEAEKIYGDFKEENMKDLFILGNEFAKKFNESQGRTRETIDYREFDFFAATSTFVLIKDNIMFWWSICDSGVTIIDSHGKQKFQSPDAWPDEKEKIATLGDAQLTDTEFNKLKKKAFRNAVNEKGEKTGYGVITGEENSLLYLNTGALSLDKSDTIFVYTDGYENYIPLSEFKDLFIKWPDNLDADFKEFIKNKNKEDSDLYGREKTLITVQI